MKQPRQHYFLADLTDEQIDYVRELHAYLWRVVRVVNPGASGNLEQFLDKAIDTLEEVGLAPKITITSPTKIWEDNT